MFSIRRETDRSNHIPFADNVVLGHLLCEAKLREGAKDVEGEPFCISNNDPIRGEDLHSMINYYYPEIKIIYTPPVLMFLLAHASEIVQKIWKGSVKLGKLDMMTPVPPVLLFFSVQFIRFFTISSFVLL
jgi:hypothetical protein